MNQLAKVTSSGKQKYWPLLSDGAKLTTTQIPRKLIAVSDPDNDETEDSQSKIPRKVSVDSCRRLYYTVNTYLPLIHNKSTKDGKRRAEKAPKKARDKEIEDEGSDSDVSKEMESLEEGDKGRKEPAALVCFWTMRDYVTNMFPPAIRTATGHKGSSSLHEAGWRVPCQDRGKGQRMVL